MVRRKKLFECRVGNALPLGVTKVREGVQFAVYLPKHKDCYLKLYKKRKKNPDYVVALTDQFRVGGVYFVVICKAEGVKDGRTAAEILEQDYEYLYEAEGEEFIDPHAGYVTGRNYWAKRFPQAQPVRGGICLEEFDWKGDSPPQIPYSDLILYQLHVRGYTRHSSSKVEHKGTFRGLMEKIPYLKELGINAVLLLPVYEFCEVADETAGEKPALGDGEKGKDMPAVVLEKGMAKDELAESAATVGMPVQTVSPKNAPFGDIGQEAAENRINYWGYGAPDTYYFAPKASYCSHGASPSCEFKEMVQAFHANGIEVLLDMYFTPGTNLFLMTDCLRSWVLKYHVDGFRINQEVMPLLSVVSDPILSGVKILANYWDMDMLKNARISGQKNVLGEYNEGFMNEARCFLKGDGGMVEKVAGRFSRNPEGHSVINFMSYVNSFTMMDTVSYDIKHNQANGEKNHDGADINYSWNCGVEGKTRKKSVLDRRMVQIRNAFLMLLTSQGTPMILAGDELGNTQLGNNNPYCQDNSISWINWSQTKASVAIHDFVQKMIQMRKSFPVLHQKKPVQMMDTLSCGMPDLSIHGMQAWRPDYSGYSRMLGMLYYGAYVEGQTGRSVYIIYNMYWEARSFDLPNLPGGRVWRVMVDTYDNTFDSTLLKPKKKPSQKSLRSRKKQAELQKKTVVPPRSAVIFVEE